MKQATALEYAARLAARVKFFNGVVCLPNCQYEAVRVKRMWIFGSTAKGSRTPNDLDILVEATEAGRFEMWRKGRPYDRHYFRSAYVRCMPDTRWEFSKWLRKGMPRVSLHFTDMDNVKPDVKFLLYPRNDWQMLLDNIQREILERMDLK